MEPLFVQIVQMENFNRYVALPRVKIAKKDNPECKGNPFAKYARVEKQQTGQAHVAFLVLLERYQMLAQLCVYIVRTVNIQI